MAVEVYYSASLPWSSAAAVRPGCRQRSDQLLPRHAALLQTATFQATSTFLN